MEESTATITEPTAVWDFEYNGYKGKLHCGRYGFYGRLYDDIPGRTMYGHRTLSVHVTDEIKALFIEQAIERLKEEEAA